jgi:hypothetical protein
MSAHPTADRIEQVGFGFMASKVLFSAIEIGLFSEVAKGPLDAEALKARLGLHARSATDFLDALVALGMLERLDERYSNTPESDFYLDRAKPSYIGNYFEMWDVRGYPFCGSLGEALKTGKPQNEIKRGKDIFEAVYAIPERLRLFLRSMTGHSLPSAMAIAEKFPWQNIRTLSMLVQLGGVFRCGSRSQIRISPVKGSICPECSLSSKNISPLSGCRIASVSVSAISSRTRYRSPTCS